MMDDLGLADDVARLSAGASWSSRAFSADTVPALRSDGPASAMIADSSAMSRASCSTVLAAALARCCQRS